MFNHHGYTLVEVLVSLSLITSTSLILINQEYASFQLFHQIRHQNDQLIHRENERELRVTQMNYAGKRLLEAS